MKFQFKNLLIEPYRLFFAAGSLYAVLSVGVWFTYLHTLDHAFPVFSWREGPAFIHSHVMIYGVIGFYVFGFILTAFPRFVDQGPPGSSFLLVLWGCLIGSQVFLILGGMVWPSCMWVAGVLEALSYAFLSIFLGRLYLRSGNFQKNKQPAFVILALLFGLMGVILAYLYYAFRLSLIFYSLSIELGTYAFLLLLVVSITYRIVPFFTGRVIPDFVPVRGAYTLEIVLSIILLRLLLVLIFRDSMLQNYASWALNFILLFVLAREWRGWIPKNLRRAPMLLVLYLGLSWILVFLGFSGYEILAHLLGPKEEVFPIFQTPALHALYIGSFGTLLLGISTRVVRGHGGLPLVADKSMLVAMLLIQLATLIRVLFPILERCWPVLAGRNYWAGIFWCAAFTLWCIRYLPVLGQPKVEEMLR